MTERENQIWYGAYFLGFAVFAAVAIAFDLFLPTANPGDKYALAIPLSLGVAWLARTRKSKSDRP